LIATNALTNPY